MRVWSNAIIRTKELALVIEKEVENEQSLSGAILISQSGEVVFEKAYEPVIIG
jgi:hypothetical protein